MFTEHIKWYYCEETSQLIGLGFEKDYDGQLVYNGDYRLWDIWQDNSRQGGYWFYEDDQGNIRQPCENFERGSTFLGSIASNVDKVYKTQRWFKQLLDKYQIKDEC